MIPMWSLTRVYQGEQPFMDTRTGRGRPVSDLYMIAEQHR